MEIWDMPKGKKFWVSASAAALALGLALGAANAQELCSAYTVVRGDTLSKIASRAGVDSGWRSIYEINTDILFDPDLIEIGQVLKIPCADGSVAIGETAPAAAETAAAESAPAATEPAPASDVVTIRFVTGTYPPYAGEDLPQEGFFAELITTALAASGADFEYEISYVEDWNSHLDMLLPQMTYDMTYPWALPDCSKVENLEPANALRCTGFDATDPFTESITAFYALKGTPFETVENFPQLLGARICRPSGHFSFDLEGERLVPPNVEMMVPQTTDECWEALLAKEADIVTYGQLAAEEDMARMGIADQVVVRPSLETRVTDHVFIAKNNPNSQAFRDAINAGLAEIRANGKWFEIVSRHLGERDARLFGGDN
jgi:polar amino acid transport system substrate-binding protein